MALRLGAEAAQAQDLSALARIVPGANQVSDLGEAVELTIAMTQGVPYRVFTLDAPRRLVLDFNELDWTGLNAETFDHSIRIAAVRTGLFRAGWSRMVLDMAEPLRVEAAMLNTRDPSAAVLQVRLVPTSETEFLTTAGLPAELRKDRPVAIETTAPKRRQSGEGPLVVVLDPGHGGIDPGAEADGTVEADLMLTFALELEEALLRAGGFTVVLTRTDDVFVPLETRVSIARRAGADVFLSLHADALLEGRAMGATIYTLAEEASDAASQKLAERHDRGDLLAGVDLSAQDDVVASVLMDLARTETAPRSDMLADALIEGLSQTTRMHSRPKLSAAFSVLKAPDIPSVLIELGFLSSPRDRARITDAKWRKAAAEGIRDALLGWARTDAAAARGLRK
ncbi:MAG: N-acetylmuramoyl-L-alanine amidase [Paracoccaceae bacterium]